MIENSNNKWEERENSPAEPECMEFVIINDRVYPADQLPSVLVDDLPDMFDEDYLYENFRDEQEQNL